MKFLASLMFLVLLVPAAGVAVCTEGLQQVDEGEVVVAVEICSDVIRVGQGFHYELKVTNMRSEPVRFYYDLRTLTLPTAIDQDGKEHRYMCGTALPVCGSLSLEDSVLLEPGSFYGQRMYCRELTPAPGLYHFSVKTTLCGCPEWPYAYSESVETATVEILVEE